MKTRTLASRRRVDRLVLGGAAVVGAFIAIDLVARVVYMIIYSLTSQSESPVYLMTTGFNEQDLGSNVLQHLIAAGFLALPVLCGTIVTAVIYGGYRYAMRLLGFEEARPSRSTF